MEGSNLQVREGDDVRVSTIGVALLSAVLLAGCNQATSRGATHHGRYMGIGIYSTGGAWSRMVVSGPAGGPAAAKTSADEHVIVVVDSDTGEIRQCGDMSGYCTGMNPWTRALIASQRAPVDLTKPAASEPESPTKR